MNHRKVAAYIVRENPATGRSQVLVFAHENLPEVPVQVPGGTMDSAETVEAALHREIEEESGLRALSVLRKVGVHRFTWVQSGLPAERHFFLLRGPDSLPEEWRHIVCGDGEDSGLVFAYSWIDVIEEGRALGQLGVFLTPEHVPELFGTGVTGP